MNDSRRASSPNTHTIWREILVGVRGGSPRSPTAVDCLKRQVGVAECGEVVDFGIENIKMVFFGFYDVLEESFCAAIGIRGGEIRPFVIVVYAAFFKGARGFEHIFDIGESVGIDIADCARKFHLDIAFEKQNAFGEFFDVYHFGDGNAFENCGERLVAAVVAMEVELHLLVNREEFFGDCEIEKFDAF